MSEHETETVEGAEQAEFTQEDAQALADHADAEAIAQENAEHDRFLETYQPVITRLPEALQIEAEARAEEVKAERVKTLVADLGISEEEAREQVYGPSKPAEPEPADEPAED